MAKLGNLAYNEDEFDKDAKKGGGKLAPGSYNVEIVTMEQKKWDDGGISLTAHCKVLDGELEGKIHYYRFSVVAKNEKQQGIARAALHKVCEIAGVEWPLTDDDLLIGCIMRLDLSYNNKGYPVENVDTYVSDVPSEVHGIAPTGKPGNQAAAGMAANGSANGAAQTGAPW